MLAEAAAIRAMILRAGRSGEEICFAEPVQQVFDAIPFDGGTADLQKFLF